MAKQEWRAGTVYQCRVCRKHKYVMGWVELFGDFLIECNECRKTARLLDAVGQDPLETKARPPIDIQYWKEEDASLRMVWDTPEDVRRALPDLVWKRADGNVSRVFREKSDDR